MSQIKYHDTNGNKSSLLPKANFGYDDYPAGGDEGRVYIGTGTENIPLAKVEDLSNLENAVGVSENTKRYDKVLGSLNILKLIYTNGNLSAVRYEGDDDATVYYRDVMTYDTEGNLLKVDHFYNTANLTAASASTTLTYDVDGNLDTATYTEV